LSDAYNHAVFKLEHFGSS
jgi:hypothetical protein